MVELNKLADGTIRFSIISLLQFRKSRKAGKIDVVIFTVPAAGASPRQMSVYTVEPGDSIELAHHGNIEAEDRKKLSGWLRLSP